MISAKLQNAINKQIQVEMNSANIYLAMSLYSETQGMGGFASWLRIQYQEEMEHAFKFMSYLLERGGTPELSQVDAPTATFGTPLQMFEEVLKHEQYVTKCIQGLYDLAVKEKDVAAQIFLQWYITEQVEEEASATAVVDKLRLIGDKSVGAIFYVDKEMGKRARG